MWWQLIFGLLGLAVLVLCLRIAILRSQEDDRAIFEDDGKALDALWWSGEVDVIEIDLNADSRSEIVRKLKAYRKIHGGTGVSMP